jgi:hypothetical protein
VTREVGPHLRDLWRRRAGELAAIVANGSRLHREHAHAASLIGKDYHDRFLVELIQNANDQAILGDDFDSTVLVVRSAHYVAVSNGGQVVTERNLERISSLADSDKTGTLVGNKGVGFKAVYQVTDAPEVYSAPEAAPGASIFDALGSAFALERDPFEHSVLVEAVEADVRDFFAGNDGLATRLRDLGFEDPAEAVLPEFHEVAGFKFPLPRSSDDLTQRAEALGIPREYWAGVGTLVVLPLRDGDASDVAQNAVDRLVGAVAGEHAQGALAVLFLRGVGRLVVLDHVRGLRWSFACHTAIDPDGLVRATVTTDKDDATSTRSEFWLARGDVFDCDEATAAVRRAVVAGALRDFGLEAWKAEDPVPVTVALPRPEPGRVKALGPSGRFCLGLPTEQSTGLPAHVDARFFAKINRDGVIFDHRDGYNELLLDVATDLFGGLLDRLRRSDNIDHRRAATLALHRPKESPGALATRVYRDGGIGDGAVVLTWDAESFLRRDECRLPHDKERDLLPFLTEALTATPDGLTGLPERGLLLDALDVLGTLGLDFLNDVSPHPWLDRPDGKQSTIEHAARVHRGDRHEWWEPFVGTLLSCFNVSELEDQSWLPIGTNDLAAPEQRVFLPAPAEALGEDDDVADVPLRVASTLRLLDGGAMRLRVDGRALTALATRLSDEKLVRRPRKVELLEDALFPALEIAAKDDPELALDLFAQAIAWIASMKDTSRRKLSTESALVPVAKATGTGWVKASRAYLGPGWGLDANHDRLLGTAYPDSRLLPWVVIAARIAPAPVDDPSWREAAAVLGVSDRPRVLSFSPTERWPLQGFQLVLQVKGAPTLIWKSVDPIYQAYLKHLATLGTTARYTTQHGVGATLWVDGLEHPERRQAVLDLMLAHPEPYVPSATTHLRRASGHVEHQEVHSLWAFALSSLGWSIVPAERGAGGEASRVPTSQAWLLSDGSRRSAYAKLLDVVPHKLTPAWKLLHAVGVWTVENAPLSRVLGGLVTLASKLDRDRLHTHSHALSLARELFTQIEDRLDSRAIPVLTAGMPLPLLRYGRLVSVDPADDAVVMFDDDPARTRHIRSADGAYRVPIARDASFDKLHAMFLATWGASRVIRSSTAKVEVDFTPQGAAPESFLAWLHRSFPRTDVAMELASLVTLGGDRTLRTERVGRHWRLFRDLHIEVGSFASSTTTSFYDRPLDLLRVSASLDPEDVVAATFELAGVRSRDLWEGYARALRDLHNRPDASRAFLREREITEVEIGEVADAAGLNRSHNVDALECALIATRGHLVQNTDLNDAAAWWMDIVRSPAAVAESLGRPDLAPVIAKAVTLPSPEGELHVLRHAGVPWDAWQEAVLRRDGKKYRFDKSIARYRIVWNHLLAVARELAIRDTKVDLDDVADVLDAAATGEPPEAVACVPPEAAPTDATAFAELRHLLGRFPTMLTALDTVPATPWPYELPVPADATKRSVALYKDEPVRKREVEAKVTVQAVIEVAMLLAPASGEQVDGPSVLAAGRLGRLVAGSWANVYGALLVLRDALHDLAPETTKRLSAMRAFHGPTTADALKARLPEGERPANTKPLPKKEVLGVEATENELRLDLASGAIGALGRKLAEAASAGIDEALLSALRKPLPEARSSGADGDGGGAKGGRRGGGVVKPMREPEFVGDLGEAFVHEWLTFTLGDAGYGPEGWRSKARERYGFPAGEDGYGYDFEVSDPGGRLFGQPVDKLHIEVKSTSTDGSGPFPMSRPEWDAARRAHEEQNGVVYVILRVFRADTKPHIGDVLLDPFAAHRRGEVRLADRDLWVTVSPPLRIGDADSGGEE